MILDSPGVRTTLTATEPDGYQGPLLCDNLQSTRSSIKEVGCILLTSVLPFSIPLQEVVFEKMFE